MSEIVKPINTQQQRQVIARTDHYLVMAADILQLDIDGIAVSFDLKGRAAGMYCVRQGNKWIRYNPYIFAKYFDDNLRHTVPHEVAHYVIDQVYGQQHVRPHGEEWQALMRSMCVEPRRTCNYDLQGVPLRQQNYHNYVCACASHQLTRRRHNRIVRDGIRYYCRKCKQALVMP
jgi:SprT protein